MTHPFEHPTAFPSAAEPYFRETGIGTVVLALGILVTFVLVVWFLTFAGQTFSSEVGKGLSVPSYQGKPTTSYPPPR